MPLPLARILGLFAAIAVTSCGSGTQNSADILNRRLQTRLSEQIKQGDVAVTSRADGATVTILHPSPAVGPDLNEQDQYVLASTLEGLLDPTLLQVQVTDTLPAFGNPDQPRAQAALSYIRAYNINASTTPTLSNTVPPGLNVNITLHCPPSHSNWTWGYDERYPTCW